MSGGWCGENEAGGGLNAGKMLVSRVVELKHP